MLIVLSLLAPGYIVAMVGPTMEAPPEAGFAAVVIGPLLILLQLVISAAAVAGVALERRTRSWWRWPFLACAIIGLVVCILFVSTGWT